MDITQLKKNAINLRKDIVKVCYQSEAGHVGGSLSSIDILNVLYFNEMKIDCKNPKIKDRDRFILSKGHIAEALYVTLSTKGFFSKEELKKFSKFNSEYIGHPNTKVLGVEMNTGALGHGLSLGVGSALAAKKCHQNYRTYVLMGDGELAEGSVWEAAMSAVHYQLDNLCAIIDRNCLQISGNTEDVMALENLKEKWQSFGFEVIELDGHNYEELLHGFKQAKKVIGRPTLLLAKTVKGKGVSFMENKASWHHGILNDEQCQLALAELEGLNDD